MRGNVDSLQRMLWAAHLGMLLELGVWNAFLPYNIFNREGHNPHSSLASWLTAIPEILSCIISVLAPFLSQILFYRPSMTASPWPNMQCSGVLLFFFVVLFCISLHLPKHKELGLCTLRWKGNISWTDSIAALLHPWLYGIFMTSPRHLNSKESSGGASYRALCSDCSLTYLLSQLVKTPSHLSL